MPKSPAATPSSYRVVMTAPVPTPITGVVAVYDLDAVLGLPDDLDALGADLDRADREAVRTYNAAQEAHRLAWPPATRDADPDAFAAAADARVKASRAFDKARLDRDRTLALRKLDRVLVRLDLAPEIAAQTEPPDPHAADTWDAFPVPAILWLANQGVRAAEGKMTDPKFGIS